jgi:hypothetical protein
VPSGVKIDPADAEAVEHALALLRAEGWLDGVDEQDVRDEMLVALWRRPDITSAGIKEACATLAGRAYLHELRHEAPTAPAPLPPPCPERHASWWGGLTTDDED